MQLLNVELTGRKQFCTEVILTLDTYIGELKTWLPEGVPVQDVINWSGVINLIVAGILAGAIAFGAFAFGGAYAIARSLIERNHKALLEMLNFMELFAGYLQFCLMSMNNQWKKILDRLTTAINQNFTLMARAETRLWKAHVQRLINDLTFLKARYTEFKEVLDNLQDTLKSASEKLGLHKQATKTNSIQ